MKNNYIKGFEKMSKIVINYGDLANELKEKNLRLFFRKRYNTGIFIQDNQDNVYQIENYYLGSYLDKMIKNKILVEFIQVDKNIIEEWEKEFWNWKYIENFIKRHNL